MLISANLDGSCTPGTYVSVAPNIQAWRFLKRYGRGCSLKCLVVTCLAFVGFHVGAKNSIDAGLVTAFQSKSLKQIGIQTHRYNLLWFRKNDLGYFPEVFICRVCVGVILYPCMNAGITHGTQCVPIRACLRFRCFASSSVFHGVLTYRQK